jgi:mono/diheme cytochrome c family protein
MTPNLSLARVCSVATLIGMLASSGCDQQGRGFALPPGDADRGRETFLELQCNACHSVGDIVSDATEDPQAIHVQLGGRTSRIKTYGELVASVINPSHKIARNFPRSRLAEPGESPMPVYNEVMTVQELVDIVTYLQGEYEVWVPEYYYPGIH